MKVSRQYTLLLMPSLPLLLSVNQCSFCFSSKSAQALPTVNRLMRLQYTIVLAAAIVLVGIDASTATNLKPGDVLLKRRLKSETSVDVDEEERWSFSTFLDSLMSRMKILSTPTTPISFNVADAEASRAKLVDHFNALAKGKNLDQFLKDGFFEWGEALTKHNKDYTTAFNKQYEAPTAIKLLQDLYGDKLIMEKVNRDKRYKTLGIALVREGFNQRKHLDDVKMLEKVMEEEGKVKETGKEVEKKIEWAALYEKKITNAKARLQKQLGADVLVSNPNKIHEELKLLDELINPQPVD